MNSNLLNSMGLKDPDISYILIGLLVLIVVCIVWIAVLSSKHKKLVQKYEIFMSGKKVSNMEETILNLIEDTRKVKEKTDSNRKEIQLLFRKNAYAFQKFGLVKYDAFHEMGGKLSFSLALLNEKDDGFIFNSIHSSNGCYSYTKGVYGGKSDVELGEEEQQALEDALNYNLKKEEV